LVAADVPGDAGGAIALSWTLSPSDDVAGQCVLRAEDGDFHLLAALDSTVTSWTDSGLTDGTTYRYLVRAVDGVGLVSQPSNEASAAPQPDGTTDPTDPTDPASVATPLDPAVPTDLADATAFLYTGENPIQVGVAPGTIVDQRAAVLRGRVLTRGGDPLPGVTVTVADHPEFGHTSSRQDGGYDLAVNGGGRLVLTFAKDGYPTVQRDVPTGWQDYRVLDDVSMVAYDSAVTTVDVGGDGSAMQVAQGSPVSDEDGDRQATLLFPAGVTATATLPDGSTLHLATAHVRATEFTVGQDGPAAMPGALPTASAYTYAAEFSIDEAVAAGADTVTFSAPVIDYTENFLHFPVGTPVPTGYYDRDKHAWVAAKDGRVVKVLSVTDGVATLDVTGKETAATDSDLSALGITADELATVGGLYPAGTSLWRVPIDHFTPWDHNWPFSPPPDAVAPQTPELTADGADICQGEVTGSVVGCNNQTLGERISVTGTGLTLAYQSERTPGRPNRSVRVPLTGATPPKGATKVLLKVEVAGQQSLWSVDPLPNLVTTASWDGKDAYGREVQGSVLMHITVGYVFPGGSYAAPGGQGGGSFGNYGAAAIDGDRLRKELTLWGITQDVPVGGWDARGAGLGGWTLSAQHFYDPVSRTLYRGDGSASGGGELIRAMQPFAGTGSAGSGADGGSAVSTPLSRPQGVTAAPDGSVYIADTSNNRIRKVSPDGTMTTIAGNGGNQDLGDGGPAVAASLAAPQSVVVAPDGSVIVATGGRRIRRIDPAGTISTIAGTGSSGWSGDGGPATAATLSSVTGMDLAADGTLYLADSGACLIRAIGPDGTIRRIAGTLPAGTSNDPRCGFNADGLKADKSTLNRPTDVAVMPDGSLVVADSINNRVRRIAADGTVSTVLSANTPISVEALPDGGILAFDSFTTNRLRLVGTDGSVRVLAGTGLPGNTGDGGPAAQASLNRVTAMAVRPDGSIMLADSGNNRVREIAAPAPGQTSDEMLIVSADGSQLYRFRHGRHVQTVNTLTGATSATLAYDTAGRLISVTDGDGNLTRIERDTDGRPTAIVAPGGQRTTLQLDDNGYLSAVTAPGGITTGVSTGPTGLLNSMTEPGGAVHSFEYDFKGWLIKDTSPDGLSTTLSRTPTSTGHIVTVTSSSGRTTTLTVERQPGGLESRTTTAPTGATVVGTIAADGTRTIAEPDGSVVTLRLGPDPRFGMAAPMVVAQTMTTPSGLKTSRAVTVSAELSNPFDPMSVQSITTAVTTNGRTATSVYTAADRTITVNSPEGRVRTVTIDGQGRGVRYDAGGGIAPVLVSYDDHGLRRTVEQGGRVTTYTYDARMRPWTVTDPDGRVASVGYDDADRLVSVTAPGGGVTGYGYDEDGRVTTVTLPSGRVHRFSYDAGGRLTTDDPSGAGAWTTDFDLDGQPTSRTRPDDVTTTLAYDDAGLLTGASETAGSVGFSYDAVAARLTGSSATVNGLTQTRDLTFDGPLLTGAVLSGAVTAEFGYAYNADMLPISSSLTSGPDSVTVERSYDKDLALAQVGGFTITRDDGGVPTGMGDGTGQWTYHFDEFGRLDSQSFAVAGSTVYQAELTWNSAGSLTRRVEQTAGSRSVEYRYNDDGRLTDVLRDGVTVEHYEYDPDGRRIRQQRDGGAVQTLAYDDADRLTSVGGVTYGYTPDGALASRGDDTFNYGFDGTLVGATVGGATVAYVYDAEGRRIARTDSAGTTQYLYGSISSPWRVSAVRGADGVLTSLLYDEFGHLASLTRAGETYYVATDQVGSPRVVTDDSGAVVKSVDYDAFGRVTSDSDPSFALPLGFAGGLTDAVTGLVRFGLRDYDPASGRWTTRDPAGMSSGQADPYAYVDQDPASHVDPTGLAEDSDEDPMTQEIVWDPWQYNKDRFAGLYDAAVDKVKGWAGKLLCWGPACLSTDRPEITVGKDFTVGVAGEDALKVGAECTAGITTTPNLHEDAFSWKAKFSASIPFLQKVPLIGDWFSTDETYSGGGGAVTNYFGLDRMTIRAAEVSGVQVPGMQDRDTYGGGGN
jgi:RHS repeat-associated protein